MGVERERKELTVSRKLRNVLGERGEMKEKRSKSEILKFEMSESGAVLGDDSV